MIKRFQKQIAAALAGCILTAGFVMPASAAPAGVTSFTAKIGNGTAKLVTIQMKEGRTGEIALAGSSVVEDDSAQNLVSGKKQQKNTQLVAAVNGGFFNSYYNASKGLSYPGNCPRIYNTIMREGKVVNAGGAKPVLGFTSDGKAMIDKVGFKVQVRLSSGFPVGTWGVNYLYQEDSALMLFTSELTRPVQIPEASTMVFLKDGKVEKITGGGSLSVPYGTDVLVYNKAVAELERGYNRFPVVGEQVQIFYTATPSVEADAEKWNQMKTVIGGGSILLLNGKVVTDQNPEFTEAKQQPNVVAQRSFVGVMDNGNLVMGTANASFNQIAAYLKDAGVADAMAMDGGASSMLYVEGDGYLTSAGRKLASVLTIVDITGDTGASKPSNTAAISIDTQPQETPKQSAQTATAEPSAWALNAVEEAIAQGLVPEALQSSFQDYITREEFCALAVRFISKKSGKTIEELTKDKTPVAFSDTTNPDVLNCAMLGIVNGKIIYDSNPNGDRTGTFEPEGQITRAEAAVILRNTAQMLGAEKNKPSVAFEDSENFYVWAKDSIDFVSAMGIMNGDGKNFNPLNRYTREQAIVTIVNMLSKI